MPTRATILIVDDEPQNCQLLGAILSPFGHQLHYAVDGAEGLARAVELKPDLVLLDVMMPGMDGFEVCKRLRALPDLAEVPVILITALDDRDSRLRGLDVGADEFLSKPIDRIELRTRVQTITRLNRYRRVVAEREKFEHIAQNASDGYLQTEAQGRVIYANRRARSFLGLPADGALPAETWTDLLRRHYQFEREMPANVGAALAEPLRVIQPESETSPAQWLQIERLPVSASEGGQILRILDVTQRMEHQRDLWRFHSRVSHKLRTPLNGLLGCLELIQSDGRTMSPADFEETAGMAGTCANRLHEEIEDILSFLGAGALQGTGGPAPLSSLPALAKNVAGNLGITTGVEVTVEPALANLFVRTSTTAAESILREILENSIKFHPQQSPTVNIRCITAEPGWVALNIADDGVSVSADRLNQVWLPYYQGEKEITGETAGMGLGLAMVAALVREQGGTFRMSNREPGPGVVVELRLPLLSVPGEAAA